MPQYIVNVNVGTTLQIEVSASSEEEAELIAINKTETKLSKETFKLNRNLEVIDAEANIKVRRIESLDERLIIKGK